MTTLQEFKSRHKEAIKTLKEVAAPKIKERELVSVSTTIGKNLDVSAQTVINYINGRGRDGYLTEAIIKELQSI